MFLSCSYYPHLVDSNDFASSSICKHKVVPFHRKKRQKIVDSNLPYSGCEKIPCRPYTLASIVWYYYHYTELYQSTRDRSTSVGISFCEEPEKSRVHYAFTQ